MTKTYFCTWKKFDKNYEAKISKGEVINLSFAYIYSMYLQCYGKCRLKESLYLQFNTCVLKYFSCRTWSYFVNDWSKYGILNDFRNPFTLQLLAKIRLWWFVRNGIDINCFQISYSSILYCMCQFAEGSRTM